MKRIYSLKDEENFVEISDGTKKYYGGDQSWFIEKSLKNRGCGIVCAANISYYMSKHYEACKNLYIYDDNDKDSFIKHMYDVERFLKTTPIGIYSFKKFVNGFMSFALSRGVKLNPIYSDQKPRKENFIEYIISGLQKNLPICYLQYYNSKQSKYNWHWMTITKYFEDENGRYIVASTWGERRIIDFDELWRGNFSCGVLYFEN